MTSRSSSGFTLAELLVVIAIIGILAGIIIPSIVYVQRESTRKAVKTNLSRLTSALETYQSDFGQYPPTHLSHFDENLRLNNFNNGNEALTASLMTEKLNGPYVEWPDEQYANTDRDRVSKNLTGWFFGDNQLREMTDRWGNPIIYINSRDYENQEKIGLYLNSMGKKYRVRPAQNPNTSTYYGSMKYQIWSIGPNNKNNTGSKDDVTSW